jgi:hypothetical protein
VFSRCHIGNWRCQKISDETPKSLRLAIARSIHGSRGFASRSNTEEWFPVVRQHGMVGHKDVVTRPRRALESEELKGTAEEQLRLKLISKECTTHLQRSNQ